MDEASTATTTAKKFVAIDLSQRMAYAFVGLLLVLIAILLFTSTRQQSQTFDESFHVFSGFEYWKHADFGRNPEHPPLIKLLATLPILSMGLQSPAAVPIPFFKGQDAANSTQFLYSGDADAILMRCRMTLALLTLGLALLIFCAAREMFDLLTAIFAMGLFSMEPVLLSKCGALVTTDMGISFFLLWIGVRLLSLSE